MESTRTKVQSLVSVISKSLFFVSQTHDKTKRKSLIRHGTNKDVMKAVMTNSNDAKG